MRKLSQMGPAGIFADAITTAKKSADRFAGVKTTASQGGAVKSKAQPAGAVLGSVGTKPKQKLTAPDGTSYLWDGTQADADRIQDVHEKRVAAEAAFSGAKAGVVAKAPVREVDRIKSESEQYKQGVQKTVGENPIVRGIETGITETGGALERGIVALFGSNPNSPLYSNPAVNPPSRISPEQSAKALVTDPIAQLISYPRDQMYEHQIRTAPGATPGEIGGSIGNSLLRTLEIALAAKGGQASAKGALKGIQNLKRAKVPTPGIATAPLELTPMDRWVNRADEIDAGYQERINRLEDEIPGDDPGAKALRSKKKALIDKEYKSLVDQHKSKKPSEHVPPPVDQRIKENIQKGPDAGPQTRNTEPTPIDAILRPKKTTPVQEPVTLKTPNPPKPRVAGTPRVLPADQIQGVGPIRKAVEEPVAPNPRTVQASTRPAPKNVPEPVKAPATPAPEPAVEFRTPTGPPPKRSRARKLGEANESAQVVLDDGKLVTLTGDDLADYRKMIANRQKAPANAPTAPARTTSGKKGTKTPEPSPVKETVTAKGGNPADEVVETLGDFTIVKSGGKFSVKDKSGRVLSAYQMGSDADSLAKARSSIQSRSQSVQSVPTPEQSPSPIVRAAHTPAKGKTPAPKAKTDANGLTADQREYILKELDKAGGEPVEIKVPNDGTFNVEGGKGQVDFRKVVESKKGAPTQRDGPLNRDMYDELLWKTFGEDVDKITRNDPRPGAREYWTKYADELKVKREAEAKAVAESAKKAKLEAKYAKVADEDLVDISDELSEKSFQDRGSRGYWINADDEAAYDAINRVLEKRGRSKDIYWSWDYKEALRKGSVEPVIPRSSKLPTTPIAEAKGPVKGTPLPAELQPKGIGSIVVNGKRRTIFEKKGDVYVVENPKGGTLEVQQSTIDNNPNWKVEMTEGVKPNAGGRLPRQGYGGKGRKSSGATYIPTDEMIALFKRAPRAARKSWEAMRKHLIEVEKVNPDRLDYGAVKGKDDFAKWSGQSTSQAARAGSRTDASEEQGATADKVESTLTGLSTGTDIPMRLLDTTGGLVRVGTQALESVVRAPISRTQKNPLLKQDVWTLTKWKRALSGTKGLLSEEANRVLSGMDATQLDKMGGLRTDSRLGRLVNLGGLSDVPARHIHYHMALDDFAGNIAERTLKTRKGVPFEVERTKILSELRSGKRPAGVSPQEMNEIMDAATQSSLDGTYNNTNILGNAIKLTEKLIESGAKKRGAEGWGRAGVAGVRTMMRYTKVLTNVGLDSLNRTPLGIAEGAVGLRKGKNLAMGRRSADILSKGAVGTVGIGAAMLKGDPAWLGMRIEQKEGGAPYIYIPPMVEQLTQPLSGAVAALKWKLIDDAHKAGKLTDDQAYTMKQKEVLAFPANVAATNVKRSAALSEMNDPGKILGSTATRAVPGFVKRTSIIYDAMEHKTDMQEALFGQGREVDKSGDKGAKPGTKEFQKFYRNIQSATPLKTKMKTRLVKIKS